MDGEDLALFREIASLLEAKVKECNSSRDDLSVWSAKNGVKK